MINKIKRLIKLKKERFKLINLSNQELKNINKTRGDIFEIFLEEIQIYRYIFKELKHLESK